MSKRINCKYKIDRRLGENIWGRAKSPLNKRSYGPGQHGPLRRVKTSGYGGQLRAKQKLKKYYGNISEKQFKKYYLEAVRMRGDSSMNLVGLLERRLDAVIYRSKFVATPFQARQFINHGHVKVNGKKVNIPSFLVKTSDVIELKESSKKLLFVIESTKGNERDVPEYIVIDHEKMTTKLAKIPSLTEIPYPVHMEPNLVIEFYSK